MDTILRDVRFGVRMLLRHPGFTAAALVMLILGIGSNVVVFSLVQTMYFKRIDVPDADRLVMLGGTLPGHNNLPLSLTEFAYVRDHSRMLAEVAAHYSNAPINFADRGDSREINGSVVSGSFFDVLRLRPERGRFFAADEDRAAGRNPVAVVSFALWQRQLDGDTNVLGRTITLNGTAFTIVGVAPRGFGGVSPGGLATDVWLPSAMFHVGYRYCDALIDPDCRIVRLIGRLAPGAPVRAAQTEAATLGAELAAGAASRDDRSRGIAASPLQGAASALGPGEAMVPILLAAAVTAVLLIACANLAGLLLARSLRRTREVAIRLAIGASRARIVRQMLTESLLLAAIGGAAGLLVAFWTKDLLSRFYAFNVEGQRANFALDIDATTIAFTAAISLATVLVFALLPALRATSREVMTALKDGGAASPSMRLRGLLVVGQVACSVMLLAGAALLVRSVTNIYRGPGYNPDGVLLLRLRPSLVAQDPWRAEAFQRQVIERLARLPQVVSASPALYPPLPGWGPQPPLWLPGHKPEPGRPAYKTSMNAVGPGYLRTLELPLLAGRDFDDRDRKGTPRVAIVNEVVARTLWPDGSAVGAELVVDGQPYRVVGIVTAAQYHTSVTTADPLVLIDYWQMDAIGRQSVDSRTHVRVRGDATALLPIVRREILAVDGSVPISEDRPLTEWLDYFFRPVRATAAAVTLFAALAMLLSVIGLYAVVSGSVAQRQREIALRMALGADPAAVRRMVLRQGMQLAAAGAVAGGAAALAAARALSAYLYGVGAHDPAATIAAAGVLAATALLACYVPARRAMTVDPIRALRMD